MKTTYVLEYKEINKLKTRILPQKKYVDYFINRTKMIRWEPQTDKFWEFTGLIDISFVHELILDPVDAKSRVNIKNVTYLIRRKQLSEYYFGEINEYGTIWHVSAEDVKNRLPLINEYHIVFDIKMEKAPPFVFKNVFYGNIYDYLELKNSEEKAD